MDGIADLRRLLMLDDLWTGMLEGELSQGIRAALRVSLGVRHALAIRVFEVREDDSVIEHLG